MSSFQFPDLASAVLQGQQFKLRQEQAAAKQQQAEAAKLDAAIAANLRELGYGG